MAGCKKKLMPITGCKKKLSLYLSHYFLGNNAMTIIFLITFHIELFFSDESGICASLFLKSLAVKTWN
jgi:hypothetical protein